MTAAGYRSVPLGLAVDQSSGEGPRQSAERTRSRRAAESSGSVAQQAMSGSRAFGPGSPGAHVPRPDIACGDPWERESRIRQVEDMTWETPEIRA